MNSVLSHSTGIQFVFIQFLLNKIEREGYVSLIFPCWAYQKKWSATFDHR